MIGDGVRIKDVSVPNLGLILDTFRRLGVQIIEDGDDLLNSTSGPLCDRLFH